MEAMQAILSRRSIRRYTDKDISDQLVHELLQAAMSAPSAGNQQSWEFIIVRDKKAMEKIRIIHPYSQMLKQASVVLLVCGNVSREIYPGFWVQDCSAAAQNILIAANDLGLGAVWLGVYPLEDRVQGIRKLIDAPENIIPLAMIALGYPGEQPPPVCRFDESRIHKEKW